MFGFSPLSPAYGRDYKSTAEIIRDWNAGKDFMTPGGSYANRDDAVNAGLRSVNVRYDKLRKVAVLKLGADGKAPEPKPRAKRPSKPAPSTAPEPEPYDSAIIAGS